MCGGTVKPVCLEPVICSKRCHRNEEPANGKQRTPLCSKDPRQSKKKKDQSIMKLLEP